MKFSSQKESLEEMLQGKLCVIICDEVKSFLGAISTITQVYKANVTQAILLHTRSKRKCVTYLL